MIPAWTYLFCCTPYFPLHFSQILFNVWYLYVESLTSCSSLLTHFLTHSLFTNCEVYDYCCDITYQAALNLLLDAFGLHSDAVSVWSKLNLAFFALRGCFSMGESGECKAWKEVMGLHTISASIRINGTKSRKIRKSCLSFICGVTWRFHRNATHSSSFWTSSGSLHSHLKCQGPWHHPNMSVESQQRFWIPQHLLNEFLATYSTLR